LSLFAPGNGEHNLIVSQRTRRLPTFIEFHFIGSTEALEFAQTKLGPFGKEPKYMEKLEVCLNFT